MTVIFLNQLKYSEHEADANFNERRKVLLPHIEGFIGQHSLFLDKKVEVTFLHAGVSSLVCILDTSEQKYILKIPLSILTSGLEGSFLKSWESEGVKVVHVFEEGRIGEHFYILMEYIGTDTLIQKYSSEELLHNTVYKEMGMVLKKMHAVKTKGYSNIVNEKKEIEYSDVHSWFVGDIRTNKQFAYIKEHGLLSDIEHGSIEDICAVIVSRIGDNTETVYCHNDFHTGNIFATNPFTVFDPWPCFHHPYMDIARSIILATKIGINEVKAQFIEGYFGEEKFDEQLLHAFIILNIWVKFPYMYKTNQVEIMDSLRSYLKETKKLLVQ